MTSPLGALDDITKGTQQIPVRRVYEQFRLNLVLFDGFVEPVFSVVDRIESETNPPWYSVFVVENGKFKRPVNKYKN